MASIERKNIKPQFCWREKSGLHCRCKYRKLPNTCPYLHKNESMEQYKDRMSNNLSMACSRPLKNNGKGGESLENQLLITKKIQMNQMESFMLIRDCKY